MLTYYVPPTSPKPWPVRGVLYLRPGLAAFVPERVLAVPARIWGIPVYPEPSITEFELSDASVRALYTTLWDRPVTALEFKVGMRRWLFLPSDAKEAEKRIRAALPA